MFIRQIEADTGTYRQHGESKYTVCMQVDRERIDSRTLRMKERKGDRKVLEACRLTERG
jgi:hypothetical protein